jgi:hypothetical protein
MPWPLYPRYPLQSRFDGSQNRYRRSGDDKYWPLTVVPNRPVNNTVLHRLIRITGRQFADEAIEAGGPDLAWPDVTWPRRSGDLVAMRSRPVCGRYDQYARVKSVVSKRFKLPRAKTRELKGVQGPAATSQYANALRIANKTFIHPVCTVKPF